MEPDSHGGGAPYSVHSLYYDSPDLRCYWEKVDGVRVRRKVRVRAYGDQDAPEGVFLEIKQRVGRIVQKRRTRRPRAVISQLLSGEDVPGPQDPVLSEALHLRVAYSLRPTLVVSYRRLAFLGSFDQGLRVTLDTDLRARCDEPEPARAGPSSPSLIGADQAILEVKFNEAIPTWLTIPLARYEAKLRRVSKYCLAVERLMEPGSS